jgi:hypothetical protein
VACLIPKELLIRAEHISEARLIGGRPYQKTRGLYLPLALKNIYFTFGQVRSPVMAVQAILCEVIQRIVKNYYGV